MNQKERRLFLIKELQKEDGPFKNVPIPVDEYNQKRLLRSLFNVRMPNPLDSSFLKIQDEYLREEILKKGIVNITTLKEIRKDIYLWEGDITRLDADAIVNAANSQLLGCFSPCHACIDNTIHTYAGAQLRLSCNEIMKGGFEQTGGAKITPAFNLPSHFVIHTVGPIIRGRVRKIDEELLASCYYSCLKIAEENNLASIAFCSISTGVFSFPKLPAAEIAVNTVLSYKRENNSNIKVIFDVFTVEDREIYEEVLGKK